MNDKYDIWVIESMNKVRCVDGPYPSSDSAYDRANELTYQTGYLHVVVKQGSDIEQYFKDIAERMLQ